MSSVFTHCTIEGRVIFSRPLLICVSYYNPTSVRSEARALDEITVQQGVDLIIDSIEGARLALICGAGLSMSAPSNIASAQSLADIARARYEAAHGAARPPIPVDIEGQARHFHAEGHLADYYLRTLIGPHVFSAEPNSAHYAVADFLLTRAAALAVSTNVDQLIEFAGTRLRGHVEAAVDRERAAAAPGDTSVLLKLHGCWGIDHDHTLWCDDQLKDAPLDTRIPEAANWLENNLLDRDLVVVGYFTHWEHLTSILDTALKAVKPARLIIVDPAESNWLQAKAPEFFALGDRAGQFCHVQENGDAFLDELRKAFSRGYIRKVIYSGRDAFEHVYGNPPDAAWLEPARAENKHLWRTRRDLEGCAPNDPSQLKAPPNEPMIGLVILKFRSVGAIWTDSYLAFAGEIIRVFRGSGQFLHALEAMFDRVTPPLNPETIVAVGAVDLSLPANVARAAGGASITRGSGRRWITGETAEAEYGL